jgi:hypothetical protein
MQYRDEPDLKFHQDDRNTSLRQQNGEYDEPSALEKSFNNVRHKSSILASQRKLNSKKF